MPELPEVETMVRGIRPHVAGRRVAALRRCPCRCKPLSMAPGFRTLASRLRGRTIVDVRRRAKRVLLILDTGAALAIEPRMTGLMLLADPPDREHLRLEWRFADRGRYPSLWFWDRRGLGTVRLFRADQLEHELGKGRLGPDALTIASEDWREMCRRVHRPIKVALLDQAWVAGIGNLYASEILHAARIHPQSRTDGLNPSQVRRLADAARLVLEDAIRHEGSTLGDGTYRNALNTSGGYQHAHRVYARAGEVCLTCRRSRVQRIVQAQRSTFFCPRCQRLR
jgi:formamidopyrimidine-DNA glycosylase